MIRVFSANDRDFSTNGDAVIKPIKSRVRNNINGEFSYELTCESKFYDYLKENKLLLVDTPQGVQPFRINNQVTRKGNRITVKARHVFYDASNLVIRDSYAVDMNCKQALEHFNDATDTQSPFLMDSNIEAVNSFRCVRKSLLEAINTVLERWGGYLVRDYWNITINSNIGRDNGITIEYRKNLQELTASYDYNNVCTKALPVGKDGILLPELYVYSNIQYEIPYTKVISIDQDINEDDYPSTEAYTEALITDLRAQAQAYVNANCVPVVTYTLKGKPEVVSDIGDIIRVRDTRIGVDITTQVIGYEYDTITGSYASLTFGNFGTNLGDLMSSVKATATEVVNEAMGEVKGSISKIYELLQGSYVVYRGYDILVMDAIPMSVAQHVIRFSNYGISVSNDGVNGTYTEVYNIETQKLTVPSISLHGNDLETMVNSKLDIDDLLEGENITLTKKNGKVTISSTGGGGGNLKYWKETSDSLTSTNYVEGDTFHALTKYFFDYKVGWWNRIYSDRYREKKYDYPAIIGYACIKEAGANRSWGLPIIISDKPEGVEIVGWGGDQTYSGTFQYKGHTWYMGPTGGYFEQSGCPTPEAPPTYNVFYGFTPADSEYTNYYPDYETAGKALIDYSELSYDVARYSGMARGGALAYFAGATDNLGTNATVKIYADGRTEGLNKVENFKLNNTSIVENKEAKLNVLGDHVNVSSNNVLINSNLNYTGYSDPANDLGVDGDTYSKVQGLTGITNHLRLLITRNRGNGGTTQLSEVKIKDSGGNYYDFTGTTVTCNASYAEAPQNLVDGSTATKVCIFKQPSESDPIILTFTLSSAIDIDTYSIYEWYTANDYADRDPISWKWQASADGTSWITIDQVSDATITTDRNSLAYEGSFDFSGVTYGLTGDEFLKSEGLWLKNPKLTPFYLALTEFDDLPTELKNDPTRLYFVTDEVTGEYDIYYRGTKYTRHYEAGTNIDITDGVITNTLPLVVNSNGELCIVYDDGQ